MTKVFKAILFFGLISIGIGLIKKMILTKFGMTGMFSFDFLFFEIIFEFGFLIITALVTHWLIKNISKNNLGVSLTKALIFGSIYGLISLISSRIFSLSIGAGIGFQFDIYDSFINFIPNGFTQGVLFITVMQHLNPKNRILTDNMHNTQSAKWRTNIFASKRQFAYLVTVN